MDSTRYMACTWYVQYLYSATIEAINVYNKNTHLALGIDMCRITQWSEARQHADLTANFKSLNIY